MEACERQVKPSRRARVPSKQLVPAQKDIETLALDYEASFQDEDEYGIFYSVVGPLNGPNGKSILVRTIWMSEHHSTKTRFITLFPL
jgi:hypothetical protein